MDYLNTDDLRKRLEELEELADAEISDDDDLEREGLRAMEGGIADWLYGETLIPEDAFTDYARDLASDIGAIADDAHWPATCIDWDRAADQLRTDYTEFEYRGETYLVR